MKIAGKPKNLKQNNSRAVFELLRHGENMTVSEIAERIHLSKTTIKKVFDSLLADGLISMCGKGESTDEGGKKPELYRLNPQFGYVIAIHVTPDEVRRRAANYRTHFDGAALTPTALSKHWAVCAAAKPRATTGGDQVARERAAAGRMRDLRLMQPGRGIPQVNESVAGRGE